MAMYGYVWLGRAMYGYLTNGEPVYDAYTTYLPAKINPSNPSESGGATVSLKS